MKPIQINLQQIRDHSPCEDGWAKLLDSKGKTKADDELFPLTDVLDSNGLEDALWCLQCLPEHDALWRKFAWWCASQVADLSDDPRVKNCLDVVWRHSNGEASDEELAAASREARSAAWSAAEAAAEAAAGTAWEAARSAAGEAAGAAWEAAEAAAWAAAGTAGVEAWAVAGADQANKLREILTAGEWRHD